jgi:hypothetical protein
MLPRETIWQLATRDGGIDVMHEVPGGRPYSELSKRALHSSSAISTSRSSISTT